MKNGYLIAYGVAFIELTRGKVAIVNLEDLDTVAKYRWCAEQGTSTFYARTHVRKPDGTRKCVRMHQLISDVPCGLVTDHSDGNGLNNQRSNIRIASSSQNNCNARLRSDNSSRYKGVHWSKNAKKFQAKIGIDGKRIHLGYFDDPADAARAYDKAALELHGEFASINFKEQT